MKKLFLIALITLSSTVLFSEGIELGNFPLGNWVDSNWDAVWEFNSGNIRILDTDGALVYDFANKTIVDFKVSPSTSGLKLSFRCEETGKNYEFTKPITNLNLQMVIDTDTGNHYEVELPIQK